MALVKAQPSRNCFYSVIQKWVLHFPDKHEIWCRGSVADERSTPTCQILCLSWQKCGNTAPNTVKILNFRHKFGYRSLVRRVTGPKGHWSKGYGVGIHCREVVRIEAQQSKHSSLCKPNHNPSLSCEPKSWEANEADTVLHYVLRLVQAPVRLSRVAAENSNPRLTNWYSLSHRRPIWRLHVAPPGQLQSGFCACIYLTRG